MGVVVFIVKKNAFADENLTDEGNVSKFYSHSLPSSLSDCLPEVVATGNTWNAALPWINIVQNIWDNKSTHLNKTFKKDRVIFSNLNTEMLYIISLSKSKKLWA